MNTLPTHHYPDFFDLYKKRIHDQIENLRRERQALKAVGVPYDLVINFFRNTDFNPTIEIDFANDIQVLFQAKPNEYISTYAALYARLVKAVKQDPEAEAGTLSYVGYGNQFHNYFHYDSPDEALTTIYFKVIITDLELGTADYVFLEETTIHQETYTTWRARPREQPVITSKEFDIGRDKADTFDEETPF